MRRVLFIYRKCPPDLLEHKVTTHIIESLRERYDVVTYCNLDAGVIGFIKSIPPDKKISAIVTHVPYSRLSSNIRPCAVSHFMRERIETTEAYQDSLLILRQIKIIRDMPIIAYTGAGNTPLIANIFWEAGGVDQVIPKTIDSGNDLKEITSVLDVQIKHYEKLPLTIPEPIIKTENGFTVVNVRINLNTGVGLVSAAAITKECNKYKGEVLIKKAKDKQEEACSGKIALDLLSLSMLEGEKIEIFVEGTDEKAANLLKHLYFGFSSRYPFTMNF